MTNVSFLPLACTSQTQLRDLVRTQFRDVGAVAERERRVPIENLRKLHELGLWNAAASTALGGLDGALNGKKHGLFLDLLRTICSGDSPTGHCFQLHNHAVWQIETIGTPEQIEEILKPRLDSFSVFAAVGSEPGRVNMYEMNTRAVKVAGGWIVNGVKNFVTNGTIADIIITSVAIEGADGYFNNLQMMMIEPTMPGVSFDDSWYQPHGMRTALSPIMTLEDVFVPDLHVLGQPGDFARQRWQGRFHLGFAANYLGSMEGIFDWFVSYMQNRNKTDNTLVQLRVGEIALAIESAAALFEKAVENWRLRPVVEAELLAMSAKSNAAQTAFKVMQTIMYSAGATAQFDEHPLGRSVRNLETHVVHAGHDRTAQIIGQSKLGTSFDSTLQR